MERASRSLKSDTIYCAASLTDAKRATLQPALAADSCRLDINSSEQACACFLAELARDSTEAASKDRAVSSLADTEGVADVRPRARRTFCRNSSRLFICGSQSLVVSFRSLDASLSLSRPASIYSKTKTFASECGTAWTRWRESSGV